MNDRQYIKLNASIQTGSNARELRTDSDGNVEAYIDLRLPDNIFAASTPQKQLDKVEMLTSKFRVSMQNMPIAQLPVDTTHLDSTLIPTKCEVDVYPYCFLHNQKLYPDIATNPGAEIVFPDYKNHKVTYCIYYCFQDDWRNPQNTMKIAEIKTKANDEDSEFSSTNTSLFEVLKNNKVLRTDHHIMQLCMQNNHEPSSLSEDTILIKNIGTLEQMWQDAIQNAVTYASTASDITINVYFIKASVYNNPYTQQVTPRITNLSSVTVMIDNEEAYLWKVENGTISNTCSLECAYKPEVHFDEQSFSIAYDTVPFPSTSVPVIWDPPFVETGDIPVQMTIDTLRQESWQQPPPKRQYQYDVNQTETSYNFDINDSTKCLPLNIIGNRETRNCFPFLPWVEVDTRAMSEFDKKPPLYRVTDKLVTRTYHGNFGLLNVFLSYKSSNQDVILQNRGSYFSAGQEGDILTYTYKIDSQTHQRVEQHVAWPHGVAAVINPSTHSNVWWARGSETIFDFEELQTTETGATITETETEISHYDVYEGSQPPPASPEHPVSLQVTRDPSSTNTVVSPTSLSAFALWRVCIGKNESNQPIYKIYQCRNDGSWSADSITSQRFVPPDFLATSQSYDSITRTYTLTFSSVVNDGITGTNRTPVYFLCTTSTTETGYSPTNAGQLQISGTIISQYRKQTVEVLNNPVTTRNLRPKLLPSFHLDEDGKFFILDGSAIDIDIGQQELIRMGVYTPPESSVESTRMIVDEDIHTEEPSILPDDDIHVEEPLVLRDEVRTEDLPATGAEDPPDTGDEEDPLWTITTETTVDTYIMPRYSEKIALLPYHNLYYTMKKTDPEIPLLLRLEWESWHVPYSDVQTLDRNTISNRTMKLSFFNGDPTEFRTELICDENEAFEKDELKFTFDSSRISTTTETSSRDDFSAGVTITKTESVDYSQIEPSSSETTYTSKLGERYAEYLINISDDETALVPGWGYTYWKQMRNMPSTFDSCADPDSPISLKAIPDYPDVTKSETVKYIPQPDPLPLPDTEVFYHETNSGNAINNILQNDYKLAIIRYADNYDKYFKAMFEEKGLKYEKIAEFKYSLIMNKNCPLAKKQNIYFKVLF